MRRGLYGGLGTVEVPTDRFAVHGCVTQRERTDRGQSPVIEMESLAGLSSAERRRCAFGRACWLTICDLRKVLSFFTLPFPAPDVSIMAPIKTKTLETVPAVYDEVGLVEIDSWVQSPTPTDAGPFQPSMVKWVRGLGTKEAKGLEEMYRALLVADPRFYDTRPDAALVVVRAFQVQHKLPPKALLDMHFNGAVPKMKGNYYYSLSQIVRTNHDISRHAEAVEEATGVPYVTQLSATFTAEFAANGKLYSPEPRVLTAVQDPLFVSRAAANAAAATTAVPSTVAAAASAAGVLKTPPAKRNKRRAPGSTAAVSLDGGKTTAFAQDAVKQYVRSCNEVGDTLDHTVIAALYKLEDE